MEELNLDSLIATLSHQYRHIIGEQDETKLSSEKIIEYIVSYYEDILSCMPGNVYWLDKNGVAVGCNRNVLDMFGFKSLMKFKGLKFEEMGRIGNWSPEAIKGFKNDTLEVIETGKSKLNIEEPPIPHRDGRIIFFLTSRVPLFDPTGNVIGVVGISIDITELKNTQAALKKSKEQAEAASLSKSEFVANMSHDVKTPLSGIIGIAELLTYRLNEENLEFAQSLMMSGQKLLNFFDNCLEIFKLENSDIAMVTEHFNLKYLLNEIHDLFQPAIKTKKLAFQIHYDHRIPDYLIGSRAGIYRVLLNLVGNAVKFTHIGFIKISVSLNEKSTQSKALITFIVEDTGIGIAKNKQHIIFDRFTRLIPSYKGTYEGSGIGLYIIHTFVQSMRGEIHVNSEEGKGSQFIVHLPFEISLVNEISPTKLNDLTTINENSENKNHERSRNKKIDALKKTARILLVEDNLTAQLIENALLSSLNCQVDPVDSGEKALEMFSPGKYDLVFLDIGLPGIQGDMVAKLIRKMEHDTEQHVPIIALTAHTSDDANKHYLSMGIENILKKPLSREQAKKIVDYYSL